MVTLLIIALCITVINYIYSAMIMPGLRDKYKYQLFAIRDETRYHSMGDGFNSKLTTYFEESINAIIANTEELNFRLMRDAKYAYKNNTQFRLFVDKRQKMFEQFADNYARSIENRKMEILRKIFWANSPYLLICVVVSYLSKRVYVHMKNYSKTSIEVFGKISEEQVINIKCHGAITCAT